MSCTSRNRPLILHISTGATFRGGERQLEWLHTGLVERGWESHLLCRKGGVLAGHTVPNSIQIPWHGEWDIAGLLYMLHQCKKLRPSVLHCHDAHGFSHGSVVGTILNIPVIYTRRVNFRIRNDFFTRWKYRHAQLIIAISRDVAEQCYAIVPPQKVHIIFSGVDWTTELYSRAKAREALHVPDDCFILGSVGHYTGQKNLPLILKLASELALSHPSVKILCIGPTAIDTSTLPSNIIMAGYVPGAAAYYNAFDAYVCTSTKEGLGTALVDAVVRDIPCVSVDAGGNLDIFPEGTDIVPQGDCPGLVKAVRALIDNYKDAQIKAKEHGLYARKRFSSTAMIEGYVATYTGLLG